jgi:hypothetical protein
MPRGSTVATLERGKGKRKHVIELVRRGRVVRLQETEAGDRRLPGYQRFSDEVAAGAGLAAEVRARLIDGMVPADAEARAIAEAAPPQRTGPAVLPVRQDLAVYNEATGLVVTSRTMAGKALDEGSAAWRKAVADGRMLPLTLVQDDPFVIRVVAGAPLMPQEEAEWVARVDWHVDVPDGRLCITGGSVLTNDDYDEDDPYFEQFIAQVALPPGRYRVALYTHVHGVNGASVIEHLAGGYHRGESLESWFARTRPGEVPLVEGDIQLVDFLVHLEPVRSVPVSGLSPLPADGWFNGLENARKPEVCPLGLAAHDVVRTARESAPGNWMYVRDVHEHLPVLDPRPVAGGAVSLPLRSLGHAVRIAWFGSRFTTTELRLTPPAGTSLDLEGDWGEGVIAVDEGGVGRVLFDADLDVAAILTRLPALAERLAVTPDGTVLEVCCVPLETMPGTADGAGLLVLRGVIREGIWRIAEASPEADATAIRGALSLAEEVERGTTITLRDEVEGQAILTWAKRNFGIHLRGNPPRLNGATIRVKKAGPEVALLGIAAFAHRFADTWPVTDLPGDDDEDDDGDGLFPTTPIMGAEVFAAASGRVYHATMAMLVSEEVGAEVPKRERPLLRAGFKHVGDVVCAAFARVGIRGYARPGGVTWACLRVSAPSAIELELVSAFAEGDAVLVTTAKPTEQDLRDSTLFRQGFADATVEDLIGRHERRLAELIATFGAPRPVVSSLRGLAEALETVLRKS